MGVQRGADGAHSHRIVEAALRHSREDLATMTMPSDAADAVESNGTNDGPRDHEGVDTDNSAYVDENNVPHPGDANEQR